MLILKRVLCVIAILFALGSAFRLQGFPDPDALAWGLVMISIAVLLPNRPGHPRTGQAG
ncbi:MAG TPA: hypothetical protein VLA12_22405 [Planctomycetaceae bacterium]|nr:hypothetical protein [Planctomycetaceae bacterium]